MMSIDRSGVFTWTAPSTSSQYRSTSDRTASRSARAIVCDQIPRVFGARGLAKEEHQFDGSVRPQLDRGPQRTARIETGADIVGERIWAGKRRRTRESSVAADELSAVSRAIRLPSAEIRKRDTRSEALDSTDCGRTSRRCRNQSPWSRTRLKRCARVREPIRHTPSPTAAGHGLRYCEVGGARS